MAWIPAHPSRTWARAARSPGSGRVPADVSTRQGQPLCVAAVGAVGELHQVALATLPGMANVGPVVCDAVAAWN